MTNLSPAEVKAHAKSPAARLILAAVADLNREHNLDFKTQFMMNAGVRKGHLITLSLLSSGKLKNVKFQLSRYGFYGSWDVKSNTLSMGVSYYHPDLPNRGIQTPRDEELVSLEEWKSRIHKGIIRLKELSLNYLKEHPALPVQKELEVAYMLQPSVEGARLLQEHYTKYGPCNTRERVISLAKVNGDWDLVLTALKCKPITSETSIKFGVTIDEERKVCDLAASLFLDWPKEIVLPPIPVWKEIVGHMSTYTDWNDRDIRDTSGRLYWAAASKFAGILKKKSPQHAEELSLSILAQAPSNVAQTVLHSAVLLWLPDGEVFKKMLNQASLPEILTRCPVKFLDKVWDSAEPDIRKTALPKTLYWAASLGLMDHIKFLSSKESLSKGVQNGIMLRAMRSGNKDTCALAEGLGGDWRYGAKWLKSEQGQKWAAQNDDRHQRMLVIVKNYSSRDISADIDAAPEIMETDLELM